MQDRRGSSGQLLVTLRVNNDLACDLAALVALDDSTLRPQLDSDLEPAQNMRNRLSGRRMLLQQQQQAAVEEPQQLADGSGLLPFEFEEPAGVLNATAQRTARQLAEAGPIAQGLTAKLGAGLGAGTTEQRKPELRRRFLRYKNVPGLAIG